MTTIVNKIRARMTEHDSGTGCTRTYLMYFDSKGDAAAYAAAKQLGVEIIGSVSWDATDPEESFRIL